MKRLLSVLTTAALCFTSASALAEYDEFECRSSGLNLKNTQLECVSCGAQRYFAKKAGGREVVPSEKWLTLLGTAAVQHMQLDKSGANKISANSDARENYQKVVISMIRDYGFCTRYVAKERAKRQDSKSSDIAPEDWNSVIYPSLTRNSNLDYSAQKQVGKYYGFDSSLFGWNAAENMNYFVLNSPDPHRSNFPEDGSDHDFARKYPTYNQGQTRPERRPSFVRRLKEALGSEYDVNGNKKSGDRIVHSGDKDNGLTECLREIERIQDGKGDPLLNSFLQSSKENNAFCKEMANSCDIGADFCSGNGGSVTQPPPIQPPPRMPPPPRPTGGGSKSGKGIN